MWRHSWPLDIIKALISYRNPEGTLTNSDIEPSTLVLYVATLLDMCPEATMAVP